MALVFGANATDVVDCGSGASVDNLGDRTVLMWIYPTTLTSLRHLWQKVGNAGALSRFVLDNTNSDELRLFLVRSGGANTNTITNNANLTTGAWWFIGYTDIEAGGTTGKIFRGSLSTTVSECTYSSQGNTTTAYQDDDTTSVLIGNSSAANSPFQGNIAWVGIWNRALSLGEIQAQQFRPHKTSGCVLFTHLGFNGTGTQPDWSGNANHGTVTGATVGAHVPLGSPFGGDEWVPYVVAAAAAGHPAMRRAGGVPFMYGGRQAVPGGWR